MDEKEIENHILKTTERFKNKKYLNQYEKIYADNYNEEELRKYLINFEKRDKVIFEVLNDFTHSIMGCNIHFSFYFPLGLPTEVVGEVFREAYDTSDCDCIKEWRKTGKYGRI